MGNLEPMSSLKQSSHPQLPPEFSVSDRRRHLRHQRRWLMLQRLWQILIVGGLAWSVAWLMTRPGWVLQSAESIAVDGAVFLNPDAVRSHLPIDYPQPLFKVATNDLEAHLEELDPIAEATILRHLFPPRLTIYIQEYRPVAILLGNSYGEINPELYDLNSGANPLDPFPNIDNATGFLDENGTWLPFGSYEEMAEGLGDLPTLEVLGMRREYRDQWGKLYDQIRRSPVTVERVDWRQLDNLILKTDLGITHHGVYDEELFARQLQLIDQMREVGTQIDLEAVVYFDVRSPDTPFVQYQTQDGSFQRPLMSP